MTNRPAYNDGTYLTYFGLTNFARSVDVQTIGGRGREDVVVHEVFCCLAVRACIPETSGSRPYTLLTALPNSDLNDKLIPAMA